MHKQYIAQKHALDRILYLLEENSIQHLSEDDAAFAGLIERLYGQIDAHAHRL